MFDFEEQEIPGLFRLRPKVFSDHRGCFVKNVHANMFAEHGLKHDFAEQFYSVSHKGVLRGLHFQRPGHDHEKLVFCTRGKILDVVFDMRRGSPTYGRSASFVLDGGFCDQIYIPRGLAHGFYVVSDTATVHYNVTTVHSPQHDAGIHWSSVADAFPDANPVVSERDASHPRWDDFVTPFVFEDADAPLP
ncbi:dTDP-4-dehydrorhamnose 3,5-epimerase family protein [Azospirillum doebereinerae]|uniref:dTDP-4-dehydrorhamnose 3,5-epimerase n=1 Tax=Azospirillum doebereinerae TaxID=92933 RepID=A0A433J6S0_9PROT|nr:dTDP-4-dehydrorhamnose 3,5-epimerase family protein [Azospirillum doebereinerae]MCG5238956.1 dTDP-4-dehydrorhamnose 3,5-epimerase family protein [Azospirillum doebereinerae]RUQ68823.1 dTDP-4-keto-6-deoxy-D-glucose epimerase [Azospirillum doebereinerae]